MISPYCLVVRKKSKEKEEEIMENNVDTNKTMTKYDRKMQARQEAALKEKKRSFFTRIGLLAILICTVIVIIVVPTIKKQGAKNTFVTVGNHELSQIEYDYFYSTAVNQFLTMYSSVLPYLGLDTTKSFASQQYNDTMTWQDYFDQMTIDFLLESTVLADDAKANNFNHDVEADYKDYLASIEEGAKEASLSKAQYIKSLFGTYATEANLKSIMQEYLLGQAYYEQLLIDNEPSEEDITAYYEENKKDYDTVDYRIFSVAAEVEEDAEEDVVKTAMETAKATAEEMMGRVQAGEDFAELCKEYAVGDSISYYESEDASLLENYAYTSINTSSRDWLFEDARKEGDITVIENSSVNAYYVVLFLGRDFDESQNNSIADTIAMERAIAYIETLQENYVIKDKDGNVLSSTKEETDTQE